MFYDLWRLFDLRLLEGSADVMPPSEMDYELCSALGWRRQLSREDGRGESQLIGKQTASASIGGERVRRRLHSHVSLKSLPCGFNRKVALGKIWPVIPLLSFVNVLKHTRARPSNRTKTARAVCCDSTLD